MLSILKKNLYLLGGLIFFSAVLFISVGDTESFTRQHSQVIVTHVEPVCIKIVKRIFSGFEVINQCEVINPNPTSSEDIAEKFIPGDIGEERYALAYKEQLLPELFNGGLLKNFLPTLVTNWKITRMDYLDNQEIRIRGLTVVDPLYILIAWLFRFLFMGITLNFFYLIFLLLKSVFKIFKH